MAASFNFELSPRPNREGLHTVYLRITVHRKHRKLKTPVVIEGSYFNKNAEYGRWIRKTNSRHRQLNNVLLEMIDSARQEYEKLGSNASKEAIIHKLRHNSDTLLSDYFEECISESMKILAYNTSIQIKTILLTFQKYLPKNIALAEVSTYQINTYKTYLLKNGNSPNTVRLHLNKISKCFKKAVSLDIITQNPFDKVDLPRQVPSDRAKLSDEEIFTLTNSPSILSPSSRKKDWEQIAVDMYHFSYLHGGIRLGDMIRLKHSNIVEGRLTYQMGKTGKQKSIKIRPEGLHIIQKYVTNHTSPESNIFPALGPYTSRLDFINKRSDITLSEEDKKARYYAISIASGKINKALKNRALRAGILKNITFHTARHSFADKARRMMKEKKGITIDGIRLMLGHTSLATTQRYLNNFDLEGQDDAHDAIFGE